MTEAQLTIYRAKYSQWAIDRWEARKAQITPIIEAAERDWLAYHAADFRAVDHRLQAERFTILVEGLRGTDCDDGNPEIAASRFDPESAWREGRDWYYADALRTPSGTMRTGIIQAVLEAAAAGQMDKIQRRKVWREVWETIRAVMRRELAFGATDTLSEKRPEGPRFWDAVPGYLDAARKLWLIKRPQTIPAGAQADDCPF